MGALIFVATWVPDTIIEPIAQVFAGAKKDTQKAPNPILFCKGGFFEHPSPTKTL